MAPELTADAAATLILAVPKLQFVVAELKDNVPAINQRLVILSPNAVLCYIGATRRLILDGTSSTMNG